MTNTSNYAFQHPQALSKSSCDCPSNREIYFNVMEELVMEAVEQNLQQLPKKVAQNINRIHITTYALNRLPALYASSEEGLQKQKQHANKHLQERIEMTVTQAINIIRYNPLHFSTPLVQAPEKELSEAMDALDEMRDVFNQPDLSWKVVAKWVKQAVHRRRNIQSYPHKNFTENNSYSA